MPEISSQRQLLYYAFLALLVLTGALVYSNSFDCGFLFDDYTHILEREDIRSFAWPWRFLFNVRRPVLYLSLAVNYAWGQFEPFGYHLFNLMVHVTSSVILFMLVHRFCFLPQFRDETKKDAVFLAFLSALVFLVHPLQTQSVTYIIQRAESMMGMFFLLTVYAALSFFQRRNPFWMIVSVLACLLGGLSKEVIVTAPVVVGLMDRLFISGSFRNGFRQHRDLYFGYLGVWVVMLLLLLTAKPEDIPTAGFVYQGISPLNYFLSQPGIILHYLRLAVWPSPLVFDYGWPPAAGAGDILLPAWVLLLAILLLVLRMGRNPATAFLGLSFFLVLLPSSSVIPLKDLAFEHRMYLPLACVIVLVILGLRQGLGLLVPDKRAAVPVAVTLSVIVVVMFSILTMRRNRDYVDEFTMWNDVIKKRPDNPRAHNNLGAHLFAVGRKDEAFAHYEKAMALDPAYGDPYLNMGTYFADRGEPLKAEAFYRLAIEKDPTNPIAHNNLGACLSDLERYDEAIPFLKKALAMGFLRAGVYHNLGYAYAKVGRPYEAIDNIKAALRLDPALDKARENLNEIEKRLKVLAQETEIQAAPAANTNAR